MFSSQSGRDTKTSLGKAKKVVMGETPEGKHRHSLTHLTLYERLMIEIDKLLEKRSRIVVYDKINDQSADVTPQSIKVSYRTERFEKLDRKYNTLQLLNDIEDITSFKSVTSSVTRSRSSRAVGVRMSLDDVIIGASLISLNLLNFRLFLIQII